MACRRTRLKGIANIPQRRKTANTGEDNTIHVSSTSEKPNLNQEHENVKTEIPKGEHTESEEGASAGCDKGAPPENTTDVHVEKSPDPEPVPVLAAEEPPTDVNKEEPKPKVPIRRKFIKPQVVLNAANRRPKNGEVVPEAKAPNPVNGRTNKIVILDEVISSPNQGQDVVIHTQGPVKEEVAESQEELLKPPEVNIVGNGNLEKDFKRLVPRSPQLLSPDVEYPIPPPSPNKINRARIKAIPRLGQRHTSFSASESEDESRRNYRQRNDSVCSSASGFQDTNSITECLSPQKPKEFNSVIQRKCRRTEQSRKLAEARRDFYLKFGNKKPDRQKLTMIDLIFYNPVTNPMSGDNRNKRKTTESENVQEPPKVQDEEEESVDDPTKAISDEENEMPAPQIKIGPEGEIIVDEQSLVIEDKAIQRSREEIERSAVVDGDFETGYGIYKRAKRSKDWSKQETLKFYKALNTIGTDFTLMCELFPRRSRRELKMKFKKEERVNKNLVDRAVMQPGGFDFHEFKHEVEMEEKELREIEKQKEREKILKQEAKKRKAAIPAKKEPPEKAPRLEKPKKKTKKKRPLDIMDVLEDDSDESEAGSLREEEEEEENGDVFLHSIQRPTRSGRVPKILDRYRAPEMEHKPSKGAAPGSLIVVASTGPNGQPVYKVCMVTGEHGRRQIGEDMNSLQKALECKENGLTDLFTLSASAAEDFPENNVTIPENNVTIPENNVTIPENNVTIPENDVTVLERNVTIPENGVTVLERNVTIPENDVSVLENGVTIPENNVTVLENGVTVLESNVTIPENDVTLPAEDDDAAVPTEKNVTIPEKEEVVT